MRGLNLDPFHSNMSQYPCMAFPSESMIMRLEIRNAFGLHLGFYALSDEPFCSNPSITYATNGPLRNDYIYV